MFYETPRLPEDISIGAVGGPTFVTDMGTNGTHEVVNPIRTMARHQWDVAFGVKSHAQYLVLKGFFMVMLGKYGRWRYKDWSDYQIDVTCGLLALVSPGVYQLVKRYYAGSVYFDRTLLKPVVGGTACASGPAAVPFVIYRNTVATPATGVGAATIDYTTGLVTFIADQSKTISSIAVGAVTNVTLASALTGSPTTLSLAGLTGADAGLLNGQSFTITTVSGATYTLAVNTAGKTITASGTASLFPQPSESLAAAGEFDNAARFDTDSMLASIDDYNIHSWGQIPVIEVFDIT